MKKNTELNKSVKADEKIIKKDSTKDSRPDKIIDAYEESRLENYKKYINKDIQL